MRIGYKEARRFKLQPGNITAQKVSLAEYNLLSHVKVNQLGVPWMNVRPRLARYFKSVTERVEPTFTGSPLLEFDNGVSYQKMLSFIDVYVSELEAGRYGDPASGGVEAELDNAKKIVLLSGQSGSGHVEVNGMVNIGGIVPNSIDVVGKLLLSSLDRRDYGALTTARGTNHGWPTYLPGNSNLSSVDMLYHINMGNILMREYQGDLSEFEAFIKTKTGVPEPLSATMFFRKMPMGKRTDHFQLTKFGPVYTESTTGFFPRSRQVFGVPLFINSALRLSANILKKSYRSYPNLFHTTPDNTLKFLRNYAHFEWFSEDISGYDKSVSYSLQMAVADAVYSRYMTDAELRLYKNSQSLGVLSPPLRSGDDGFLYRRQGQTVSGSIWTDKDGSVFNLMRIFDGIEAATGWSPQEVARKFNVDWTCLVFGDDCVVGFRKDLSFSVEKYLDRSLELGFKTDFLPGIVFLMNVFDIEKNSWHGVGARALDKSFNKEYVVTDPVVAAFGDGMRWARIKGHIAEDELIKQFFSSKWHHERGLFTLTDLVRFCGSRTTQSYLVEYGRAAGQKAIMRDMLAGLTHGSLDIDDLANSVFSASTLDTITRLLTGQVVDEKNFHETEKTVEKEELFDYIRWSVEGTNDNIPHIIKLRDNEITK